MTVRILHIAQLMDRKLSLEKAIEPTLDNLQVSLWVPSQRVVSYQLDMPAAPRKKWSRVLPWMSEGRLLQPVEEMHLTVCGHRQDRLDMLAVAREDLQQWLQVADAAGVCVEFMWPDFLALPWEPGQITAIIDADRCLARVDQYRGFAIDTELAWPLLEQQLGGSQAALRLYLSVADRARVPDTLRQRADIHDGFADWRCSQSPAGGNLLHGEFQPRAISPPLKRWLPTWALIILVLALLPAHFGVSNRILQRDIADLEKYRSYAMATLFPAVSGSQDIRTVAQQQLDLKSRQNRALNEKAMQLLKAVDEFVSACECALQEMNLRADRALLTIEGIKPRNHTVKGYVSRITPRGEQTLVVLEREAG